jgi:hypothetical protein
MNAIPTMVAVAKTALIRLVHIIALAIQVIHLVPTSEVA